MPSRRGRAAGNPVANYSAVDGGESESSYSPPSWSAPPDLGGSAPSSGGGGQGFTINNINTAIANAVSASGMGVATGTISTGGGKMPMAMMPGMMGMGKNTASVNYRF